MLLGTQRTSRHGDLPKQAEIAAMEAAALALYKSINPVVVAKFEAGELATEDEADAYGSKITAAFAAACLDATEDDFPEVFKAKLAGSDTATGTTLLTNAEMEDMVVAAKAGYLKKKGGFRKNWLWRWFAIEMNVPFLIRKWCTIRGPRPNLKEKEAPEQVAKDVRAAKGARRPGWPS